MNILFLVVNPTFYTLGVICGMTWDSACDAKYNKIREVISRSIGKVGFAAGLIISAQVIWVVSTFLLGTRVGVFLARGDYD